MHQCSRVPSNLHPSAATAARAVTQQKTPRVPRYPMPPQLRFLAPGAHGEESPRWALDFELWREHGVSWGRHTAFSPARHRELERSPHSRAMARSASIMKSDSSPLNRDALRQWLQSRRRTWRWNDGHYGEYDAVEVTDTALRWFHWSHDVDGGGPSNAVTQSVSTFLQGGPPRPAPQTIVDEIRQWLARN